MPLWRGLDILAMTAFCKDCRHIHTRLVEELQEAAAKQLRTQGSPQVPYWGCLHEQRAGLEDEYGFVSCERMRLNGAPCGPDGVLFEAIHA